MTPQKALSLLCSAIPFSPNESHYRLDVSGINFDEIYSTIQGHDYDAIGALLTYLNLYPTFSDTASSTELMSVASCVCKAWMNADDKQFAEDFTPIVHEVLASVKAMDSLKSDEVNHETLRASWLFNFVLLFDTPVFDHELMLQRFWETESTGTTSKEPYGFEAILKLAITNRWSLVALMAITRFVGYYNIAKMDNSMMKRYQYILEHEEWLVRVANAISVDMASTVAWFFYIMKSDVFGRGFMGKSDASRELAHRFWMVATQIPARHGFHSSNYRMASKLNVVPVIEHLFQYWLKQDEFGATVDFEDVELADANNSGDLQAIYKKSFSGMSDHAKWSREIIALGLQERFGHESIRWESGYAVTGDRVIIVSEFNELDVAKELMSDSINSIGFVRADTGDAYPFPKKIVIASVGFTKSELPQVYQLIVGNLGDVINSNYKALISYARGSLLNLEINGVGNLAQLTLCDADTIRKYSNLTAY